MTPSKILVNANQATALMAYRLNEIALIYPITPASEMAELSEKWSSEGVENIFGDVPMAVQMQGEGGVAGAMHGALQTGSLTTTFTASQGLLLMLPNLYKIAGQFLPNVIHVATRSIATHSLSVFGDHSDIMAVRQSGYALLGSSNAQEAYDNALISQIATLKTRIPFIHFFDGFRTSHELNVVETISESVIRKLLPEELIYSNFQKRLTPHNPSIRGTAQGPNTFFEAAERTNEIYDMAPGVIADIMLQFQKLTGRSYKPFEYVGPSNPKNIIIAMGSSCDTIEYTLNHDTSSEDTGLIKVRLYRPFSAEHLISEIPESCRTITVLDRTKENGVNGEPLYLDVLQAVKNSYLNNKINLYRGRYGLSSKEFNPQMVMSIIGNARSISPKEVFTVGINDDVTKLSLDYTNVQKIKGDGALEILIQDVDKSLTAGIQNILVKSKESNYIQSYTTCSYKKNQVLNETHIRFSESPIRAPFLVSQPDILILDSMSHLQFHSIIKSLKRDSILLIISKELREIKLDPKSLKHLTENNIGVFFVSSHGNLDVILQELLVEVQINKLAINKYLNENYERISFSANRLAEQEFNYDLGTNEFKVSDSTLGGIFSTTQERKLTAKTGAFIPQWNNSACVECGLCSLVCPQGALRLKLVPDESVETLSSSFQLKELGDPDLSQRNKFFSIQINPDQCTSCNYCVEYCPTEALVPENTDLGYSKAKNNWEIFKEFPEVEKTDINNLNLFQQQFIAPLFKYAENEKRCTESPYIKLLTQLYGDRLLIANATGSSSIFGGSLTSLPFYRNSNGEGPAWANSLFEDNAEFGFGFHLTQKFQLGKAKRLLLELMEFLPDEIVATLLLSEQNNEKEIEKVKQAVKELKKILDVINSNKANTLAIIADEFIKKEIWIVGGDGWAYDIGFGGIDHVIASGENVNILILDNEGYSNTGGQASKATPEGKRVKFAYAGKKQPKKDIGKMLSTYPNTQILNVSIFNNPVECLNVMATASLHNGPTVILADCTAPTIEDRKLRKASNYNYNNITIYNNSESAY